MALALALLGIIVIGALVAGTFTAGRLEMTSGRNVVYTAQASEAAEAGLNEAFLDWNGSWNTMDRYTPTAAITGGVPNSPNAEFETTVTRLGGNLFLVQSTGTRVGRGGQVLGSRVLGRLARITPPDLNIQAAVTANAEVRVAGSAEIDGNDGFPEGWDGECPAPSGGVYGIRTSDEVRTSGAAYTIEGQPDPISENDATITPATFSGPFAELIQLANIFITGSGTVTKQPGPLATAGVPSRCDYDNQLNWGEPYRNPPEAGAIEECKGYFPVVYYSGSGTLRLSSGRAQGIILSAGDIDVAGNFEFNGIMFAMGSMRITGTGNKVTGAILTGNADIDDDFFGGNPVIQYSSCAINTVLAGSAKGRPLAARDWVQRW